MEEEKKTAAAPEETVEQAPKKEKVKKPKTTKQDKEIEQLREELATQKDQMLRTLAEYDNYRKRTQKEKESMYSDGIVYAVKAFLPVIDNLERALAAAGEDTTGDASSMVFHAPQPGHLPTQREVS